MEKQVYQVVYYADRETCADGNCSHCLVAYDCDGKEWASFYLHSARPFEEKKRMVFYMANVLAVTGTGAIMKYLEWQKSGKSSKWLMK